MKLKVDKPSLEVFGKLSNYGLKQDFDDKLFQTFYQDTLQSLIIKSHKASKRIVKALTLQLTPGEAICLRWTAEFWNRDIPNSYESAICKKYFPELHQLQNTVPNG